MTKGAIKGHLLQLSIAGTTNKEQKEAIKLALQALEVLKTLEPFVTQLKKEISNARNTSPSTISPEPGKGGAKHRLARGPRSTQ